MSDEIDVGPAAERAALIAEIEQAFATNPLPHPITTCGSDCPECRDITAEFYGRSWPEIDNAKLEANKSMSFFTAQAFHYFLPAYLRYSLRHFDLNSEVCEFTVYALTPDLNGIKDPARISWLRERLSCLDRKQAEIVLRFLVLVSQDEELGEFHYDIQECISSVRELLNNLKLLD